MLLFSPCSYEQCFDQWYKDVFLQQKAGGQAGCREEYAAYWSCYMVRHAILATACVGCVYVCMCIVLTGVDMMQKELRKDKTLVEGIKNVMPQDASERWAANMAEQKKSNSKNQ